MPSFGGSFQPVAEHLPLPGLAASSWSATRPRPPETTGLFDGTPAEHGGFTSHLPITLLSSSFGGDTQRMFFDDYYNQIHFVPRFVDFGPIGSQQTVNVAIWNAHLTSVTLASIAATSLPDVGISGPALPLLFKPLQTVSYAVTAAANGVPLVDGSYLFTFGGYAFVLVVNGLRAKLGSFPPNWRDSYRVTYEYRSEVFTSRKGKEQRRALRTTPRKTLDFTTTVKFNNLRKLRQDINSWQNRLFIIPELPRRVAFADILGTNVQTTTLESMPDWVVPDAIVILSYRGLIDSRKVQSVDGLNVTFATAGAAWPQGTLMHPALSGFLAADLTGSNITNGVAEVSITFNVKVGTEPVIAVPAAPLAYNGREVFLTPSNWATPQQANYRTVMEQVDYARGVTEEFRPVAFNTLVLQSAFTGRNFDALNDLVNFFKRLKGQRGEFYRPTGQSDLDFVQAVAGSHNLRVKGTDANDNYKGSTVYADLCILLNDGTRIFRTVADINTISDDAGDDSVISLTTTFDNTLSADQILLISWMPVWRLSSDQLIIEWLTNAVGQTQITTQTLEDLTGV